MNLGGYDDYAFNEALGNAFLKEKLESNSSIFCHFSEGDKTPNTDGTFEIIEKSDGKYIPTGTFCVQIKTLNHDYINKNTDGIKSQYKYSCDTKIFNVVKEAITLDPCILFMVDVMNKRIFYKYISIKCIFELDINNEEHKTVYFNDQDEITDIEVFYDTLKDIHFEIKEQRKSINSTLFVTNDNLTTEERELLQEESDYLNDIFYRDLAFVKKRIFPNVWKLGIAYLKDENSLRVGVYWIKKGTNGEFYTQLSPSKAKTCVFIHIANNNISNLRDSINSYIKFQLEEALKKKAFPLEFAGEDILSEIIFYFLDKISCIARQLEHPCKLTIYYRDNELLDTVEQYYSALYQCEYEKLCSDVTPKNELDNAIFLCDPIQDISHVGEETKKKQRLIYLLLHPEERDKINISIWLHGIFEYELVNEAIEELKKRNITKIKRVWKPKDYLNSQKGLMNKGINRIETGYLTSDYYENLEKFAEKVPLNYNIVISNGIWDKKSVTINRKYLFGFSYSESFSYCKEVYSSDNFCSAIDNTLMNADNITNQERMQERDCLVKGSGISADDFNANMPLTETVFRLLFIQLCKSYSITDYRLGGRLSIFH